MISTQCSTRMEWIKKVWASCRSPSPRTKQWNDRIQRTSPRTTSSHPERTHQTTRRYDIWRQTRQRTSAIFDKIRTPNLVRWTISCKTVATILPTDLLEWPRLSTQLIKSWLIWNNPRMKLKGFSKPRNKKCLGQIIRSSTTHIWLTHLLKPKKKWMLACLINGSRVLMMQQKCLLNQLLANQDVTLYLDR